MKMNKVNIITKEGVQSVTDFDISLTVFGGLGTISYKNNKGETIDILEGVKSEVTRYTTSGIITSYFDYCNEKSVIPVLDLRESIEETVCLGSLHYSDGDLYWSSRRPYFLLGDIQYLYYTEYDSIGLSTQDLMETFMLLRLGKFDEETKVLTINVYSDLEDNWFSSKFELYQDTLLSMLEEDDLTAYSVEFATKAIEDIKINFNYIKSYKGE